MPESPEEAGKRYRDYVEDAARESQRNYDKTLITLAGGALGLSFALVDKLGSPGGVECADCLFWAWICWGLSLGFSLASFYISRKSLVASLIQLYAGNLEHRNPGGRWAKATEVLNILAGLMFFGGVLLIALFARSNLEGIAVNQDKAESEPLIGIATSRQRDPNTCTKGEVPLPAPPSATLAPTSETPATQPAAAPQAQTPSDNQTGAGTEGDAGSE